MPKFITIPVPRLTWPQWLVTGLILAFVLWIGPVTLFVFLAYAIWYVIIIGIPVYALAMAWVWYEKAVRS